MWPGLWGRWQRGVQRGSRASSVVLYGHGEDWTPALDEMTVTRGFGTEKRRDLRNMYIIEGETDHQPRLDA